MHPDDLAELARLVADELAERLVGQQDNAVTATPARWLNASEVATILGVTRDAVYRRADELGARRIGSGPKARLRFDAEDVTAALGACSTSRESLDANRPQRRRSRVRLVAAGGQEFPLLPVRGVE
jgi:predicted DNA-binding transcriptional regulator AlpA